MMGVGRFAHRIKNGIRTRLIIADGHHRNEYLQEFSDHKLYFDGHIDRQAFETIGNRHNRVLIVGSGQTMIDRLAELKNYGYDGEIHVVSRRGVLPWLFSPELYRPDNNLPPYQFTEFTPENLIECKTEKDLQFLWEKEIALAVTTGYGVGHVLSAFYKEDSIFKNFVHPSQDVWKKMTQRIDAYYSNPTSPQRFRLYQQSIGDTQFISKQSSITSKDIEPHCDGFTVTFVGQEQAQYDAVFNAASCARLLKSPNGRIRSPLISTLDRDGHIRWGGIGHDVIIAGQQNTDGLYYAGPASYKGKWGVETFRDGHQQIAKESLTL